MAQRYGGQYSPGQIDLREAKKDRRVRDAAGARSNVLFVPGVVMLLMSIGGSPTEMAFGLVGFGAFTLAAWLLREGLRAEAAYNLRRIAKRPAIPRKMFATLLTGLGVAIGGFISDAGIIGSAMYGIIAMVLHVVSFGIDPLRDKHVEGVDEFHQDRVARVVDEAEAYLDEISARVADLGDRDLSSQVGGFVNSARDMIDRVEQDPRDLTSARKFLGVYLMGARDATVKFADLWHTSGRAHAKGEYQALLRDLQDNFAAKTERLLITDRTDVDVEIKVLRDRLHQEGMLAEQKGLSE